MHVASRVAQQIGRVWNAHGWHRIQRFFEDQRRGLYKCVVHFVGSDVHVDPLFVWVRKICLTPSRASTEEMERCMSFRQNTSGVGKENVASPSRPSIPAVIAAEI